jgi:hypothetical protein
VRTLIVALVCLFGGLLAIYGLSYSGAFTADDEHLFISGAQSLAQSGQFEAPQVYGNARMQDDWRDVEPLQPLLGAMLITVADALALGRTQTPFILNSIVTALTACVVFLTARIRAPLQTAVIIAVLYGVATTAWPYAKTYFRDPLAALMLAIAYLGYELAHDPPQRVRGWILIVLGLAGGLLAKSTTAIALIAFPVAALLESGRDAFSWPRLRVPLVAATITLTVAFVLSISIPVTGPLNRLSWVYLVSLAQYIIQSPHPRFIEALVGPFISPGKSLFVYSPLLLLALAAFVVDRANWKRWLLPWLMTLGLVVAQALFYDGNWWGSVNWGLRFLLPALPLLTITCAPIVDVLWPRWWWVVVSIAVVSALVQLGGVAINARDYQVSLYEVAPNDVSRLAVWSVPYSPVLGHWRWLLQGHGIDLAWARLVTINPAGVIGVQLGWLLLLAVAGYGLYGVWNERLSLGVMIGAIGLSLIMPFIMLSTYRPDPLYFETRDAYRDGVQFVSKNAGQGDVVLVQSYGAPIRHYFINNARLPVRWYSLPTHFPTEAGLEQFTTTGDAAAAIDPVIPALVGELQADSCRLWLVNSLDTAPDSFELVLAWLADRFAIEMEKEISDNIGRVHISLFTLGSACRQD